MIPIFLCFYPYFLDIYSRMTFLLTHPRRNLSLSIEQTVGILTLKLLRRFTRKHKRLFFSVLYFLPPFLLISVSSPTSSLSCADESRQNHRPTNWRNVPKDPSTAAAFWESLAGGNWRSRSIENIIVCSQSADAIYQTIGGGFHVLILVPSPKRNVLPRSIKSRRAIDGPQTYYSLLLMGRKQSCL